MKIFDTFQTLSEALAQERSGNKTIGFVPTMGALHDGHLSLIGNAAKLSDIVLCSIFVNPTQFNDPEDLKKYPRNVERDIALLEKNNCSMVLLPGEKDVYPDGFEMRTFDFDGLDKVMEGASRPGHFQGVANVVYRFFDAIEPDYAFFGEKDFQQLRIIETMVIRHALPVKIVRCPIVREQHGLAMSSRNERLTAEERQLAGNIYKALLKAKSLWNEDRDIKTINTAVKEIIAETPGMSLDYFRIAKEEDLLPVVRKEAGVKCRAFIAVFLGNVRLIDNLPLYD